MQNELSFYSNIHFFAPWPFTPLSSIPRDDTIIFWNISLLAGIPTLGSVSLFLFCEGPHRGMTCWRQKQAGWPRCRKDEGDRISLQQTMGVMRVDSVKPNLLETCWKSNAGNSELKTHLKKKKKTGEFFRGLVSAAASRDSLFLCL